MTIYPICILKASHKHIEELDFQVSGQYSSCFAVWIEFSKIEEYTLQIFYEGMELNPKHGSNLSKTISETFKENENNVKV